jgi:hypothetical protein
MKELTENQKRGLEFFESLNKVQLILWARKTDSGHACMELLGERLAKKNKNTAPGYR